MSTPFTWGDGTPCYEFWKDFSVCLRAHQHIKDPVCADFLADYNECLHHRKEVARMQQVQAAAKKQGSAAARK